MIFELPVNQVDRLILNLLPEDPVHYLTKVLAFSSVFHPWDYQRLFQALQTCGFFSCLSCASSSAFLPLSCPKLID